MSINAENGFVGKLMLPTVFLSLSGANENFVRRVHEFLPDGLAYFYPRSFANGEQLISAMEERIGKATMFVLFASKSALAPTTFGVGFELDRARLAKIKNPRMRVLVLPIDNDVSYRDLPEWMRDYWIGKAGLGAREIARYICRALLSGPLGGSPVLEPFGRGPLTDRAKSLMQETVLRTGQTPNVIVLSGISGIGRRTFGRKFLSEGLPSSPELAYGPEFLLPQFADLMDLYRSLRQEIETDLSLTHLGKDLEAFGAASIETQASEVLGRLMHFGELGQAVTVVTGNGIFEDRGFLKTWVPILFNKLYDDRYTKLVIVSNRLLHENELRAHSNILGVPPALPGWQ